MDWISNNIQLVSALVLTAAGIAILLPKARKLPRSAGWLLALSGVFLFGLKLFVPQGTPVSEDLLFGLFGGGAILSGILMITSRNPVYGALWFALTTLSVSGLYILQSAPFLAATTIIVYAGAIIVTFLFVIMLAQQEGLTVYDQRTRQPFLATIFAFVLLGALLATTFRSPAVSQAVAVNATEEVVDQSTSAIVTNPLSRPGEGERLGTMHGLGRSLFGDYLFAVELAGTLLLIASIGAIIVAPKKEQGTL